MNPELPLKLFIKSQPLAALKPHPGNARTHCKRQIKQIEDSIRCFGFTDPILVDRNGVIIAGHGRVQAAKMLNMDRVPTIALENLTTAPAAFLRSGVEECSDCRFERRF